MTDVRVGDELILVVHLSGGDIRAYQGYCPHRKTTLADEKLDSCILACAAHSWQFDLLTGVGVNPKSCRLDRYEVKIEDEGTRRSPCVFARAAREQNSHGRSRAPKIRTARAPWHGRGTHRGARGRYRTGQP